MYGPGYKTRVLWFTVRNEMKCSRETVILDELVHDTTRKFGKS